MNGFNLALYLIFALLLSCRPTVDSEGVQGAQASIAAPKNILLISDTPSNNPTPRFYLQGNFRVGNTVALYLNDTCSGEVQGSSVAQNNSSVFVDSLPLINDGFYTFWAKTISRGGTSSSCSTAQASYTFQTVLMDVVLELPSKSGPNLNPLIIASNLTVGGSVYIFKDSGCTALVGQEDFVKSSVVEVRVNDGGLTNDGPYTFFARQGIGQDIGPCSGTNPSPTYILNTKPQFMQTETTSPGKNLRATIKIGNGNDPNGALWPGAEVKLYTDSLCLLENLVGSGVAESNETTVSITIDKDLTQDGTYKFYSTQRFNGRTSPCSSGSNVFAQYILDTMPDITTRTESPDDVQFPTFTISELVPGAMAKLYDDPLCSNEVGSAQAPPNAITPASVIVQTNKALILSGEYSYYANQILPESSKTDFVGDFISSCSVTPAKYIFEAPKVLFLTTSPNNVISPILNVNQLSGLSTQVDLFEGSDCGGSSIDTIPTSGNTSVNFNIPTIETDGLYYYSVKQNGGPADCIGSARYELNTKPDNWQMVDPPTPIGNVATPTFKVANIIDYATSTTTLHNNSNCIDPVIGSATGMGPTIDINVSVPIDSEGPQNYFARQIVPGLVTPVCSVQNITYTYDLKPPVVKLASNQPTNDPTPTIVVEGVLDEGKVTIYSGDNGCDILRGTSNPGNGTIRNIVTNPALTQNDQGTNTFWARQEVAGILSDCSIANVDYNFNSSVGDILMVTDNGAVPVASGAVNPPWVEVRNVAVGALVQLFADNSCTTLMGAGTSNSSIINIRSFPLGLEGQHKYYARQTIGTSVGPCSSNFATYNLDTTPNNPILITASPNTLLTPVVRVTDVIPGAQVKLFLDVNCSDLVGEATAISSQVDVSVNQSNPLIVDGHYYFYVRQINSGHISPCSGASSPVYILDTRPQDISIISAPAQTSPTETWNDPTPVVRVSGVEPGANVILFNDMNCQDAIGSSIAQQNFVDIDVMPGGLPSDGPYDFFARQSYRGHTSWCSGNTNPIVSTSYTLNTSITLSVAGNNPNNLLRPSIIASQTVSGADVQLFSDSKCASGTAISDPTVSPGGDTIVIIQPPFAGDGDKAIFGKQTIENYFDSPCTPQLTYSLFSAPTITLNTGVSPTPGNINTPTFILSDLMVEAGVGSTTVTIFDDPNCESPVVDPTEITNSTMSVTIDQISIVGEQTYYAQQDALSAGHISSCSPQGVVYDYNLSPTISMITDSPNDELKPTVQVSNVVFGANVTVYTDVNCSSVNQVGSLPMAGSSDVLITLDNDLMADGKYFFYAQQEVAGIFSSCSAEPAIYDLITDNFIVAPVPEKSTSTTPNVEVTNLGEGDRVTLYFDKFCEDQASDKETVQAGNTSVSITSYSLPDTSNIMHTWYTFREIGGEGFRSQCIGPSQPFELNIMPSNVVAFTTPNPGVDLQPEFEVMGVNSFATVTIYSEDECKEENKVGEANSGVPNSVIVKTEIPLTQDGPFSVWARQYTNGFLSDCSGSSGTYILDTAPQGPITLAGDTQPIDDKTSPLIRVEGVVSGARVDLHLNADCSSGIAGTGVVAPGNDFIEMNSFPLGQDGSYEFWAKQNLPTDPAYVSPCSTSSVPYSLDTTPTGMQTLTVQPSAQNSPLILVEGVGQGDFVQLFRDNICSTPSGSNISSGSSVTIKVLPALSEPGPYTFYSKRTQSGGLGISSKCSGAAVNTNFDFNPALTYQWEFSAEVKQENPMEDDHGGAVVTGSQDYLVMGVPGNLVNPGRIFFWKYNGFFWESEGSISGLPGDLFGFSLDMYTYSSDGLVSNGDLIIVGAPGTGPNNRGAAYVYTYNNGGWINEQRIPANGIADDNRFGSSVAINQFLALIGGPGANSNTGMVRSFENRNGTFTLESIIDPPITLSPGDEFGFAVSVNGANAMISAPLNGRDTVFLYKGSGGIPVYDGSLAGTPNTEFGFSVDLSSDFAIVGAPAEASNQGRAYVYNTSDYSEISILQSMVPTNLARFGASTSITADPNEQGTIVGNAIVGEPDRNTGQGYIFAGNNFVPVVALPLFDNSTGDRVGASVFIFDDNILVGAPGKGPINDAGAVYIYRNDL